MKRHEFTVVINNKEIRKVQVDFTTELGPSTGVLNLEGVTPSKHVFHSLSFSFLSFSSCGAKTSSFHALQ